MSEDQPEELHDLDLELRFNIARQWALAARDVAQQSHIALATKVWDFIDNNTALGVPVANGSIRYYFTENPKKPIEDYAFLSPVLSKDSVRLKPEDFRQGYASGIAPSVAQYREGSRAIYFPENLLSDVGKGIIMLHEACHAKNDLEKQYDKEEHNSHWLEEADVYVFEFNLLSGLGGEAYEKLIRQATEQIEDNRDGERVFLPRINKTAALNVWNNVFGTNLTSKEVALWTGVASMDSFWRYLESNVVNPRKEFAAYLSKKPTKQ